MACRNRRRRISYRQMINNLFAEEMHKDVADQNGFAIQCLEHLRTNTRLTPFELCQFVLPTPGEENAEALVYGDFNWGIQNMTFLRLIERRRFDDDDDSDINDHPFNFNDEINLRPRNRQQRMRSRPRSRSRSPITLRRYQTVLECHIREEVEARVRSEVRRELEPRIRREFEVEYQMWREVDLNNAIAAEGRRIIDADIEKLRELAARPFTVDTTLDNPNKICPICLESVVNRRPLSTGCGHLMCLPCYLWIYDLNDRRLRTCPDCRQQMEIVPHPVYL